MPDDSISESAVSPSMPLHIVSLLCYDEHDDRSLATVAIEQTPLIASLRRRRDGGVKSRKALNRFRAIVRSQFYRPPPKRGQGHAWRTGGHVFQVQQWMGAMRPEEGATFAPRRCESRRNPKTRNARVSGGCISRSSTITAVQVRTRPAICAIVS